MFFQIFKGPSKPQKRWKTGKSPKTTKRGIFCSPQFSRYLTKLLNTTSLYYALGTIYFRYTKIDLDIGWGVRQREKIRCLDFRRRSTLDSPIFCEFKTVFRLKIGWNFANCPSIFENSFPLKISKFSERACK